MIPTYGEIGHVYSGLRAAKRVHAVAVENEIEARFDLEARKLVALADGRIEGKNETLREAAARALFSDEYALLLLAEKDTRNAKLELDLAQLAVDTIRLKMRALELAHTMQVEAYEVAQ